MKKNQSGFGAVEILLILFILGLLGFAGWHVYDSKKNSDESISAATTVNVEKKPSKQTNTAKDPTATWQTFSSQSGKFTVKYPKTWVQPSNQQYCDATLLANGLYVGPNESSVLKCGTDGVFGEVNIDSNKENISGFDFSTGYTGVTKKSVKVDGVSGERITAVSSGQQQLLGSLPDGTVVVEYTFTTNGKIYVAHYIKLASYPDVLSDFDLMITKTLKFQ